GHAGTLHQPPPADLFPTGCALFSHPSSLLGRDAGDPQLIHHEPGRDRRLAVPGALFRFTVNELPATSGTAEATSIPLSLFCRVARTKLDAVRATPDTTADLAGAAMFTVPLRPNSAGPATLRAVPSPATSARTPK